MNISCLLSFSVSCSVVRACVRFMSLTQLLTQDSPPHRLFLWSIVLGPLNFGYQENNPTKMRCVSSCPISNWIASAIEHTPTQTI